jgi:hypothetical protein
VNMYLLPIPSAYQYPRLPNHKKKPKPFLQLECHYGGRYTERQSFCNGAMNHVILLMSHVIHESDFKSMETIDSIPGCR